MIPLILTLAAAVLAGAIPLQLHLDTRRGWMAETDAAAWHGAEVFDLPHPRMSLMPVRQSPTDLPARWDTAGLAAVELGTGARHASDVVADTPLSYKPLHLSSVGEVTEEFDRIIAVEFGAQRCDSCTVGRDGEPSHVSCPGCSCPCSVAELPAGVDGYAIAGGTR